MYETVTKVLLA